jgi:hypothetical protein
MAHTVASSTPPDAGEHTLRTRTIPIHILQSFPDVSAEGVNFEIIAGALAVSFWTSMS